MKQLIFVLFTLLCTTSFADSPDTTSKAKSDTARMNMGNVEILIVTNQDGSDTIKAEEIQITKSSELGKPHKKKPVKTRPQFWGGLALGSPSLVTSSMQFKVPKTYSFLELNQSKSIATRLELTEINLNLSARKLYLVTGLGLEWDNYRFTNHYSLIPDTSTVTAIPSAIAFKKNKLTSSYLEVPLLIGYDCNPGRKKKFWFAAGGFAGLNLGAHTKQVYRLDGKSFSDKVHDDFNLNPYRYGVTVRVGYKHTALFADYILSEVFKPGSGPQLYPFTVGIKIL